MKLDEINIPSDQKDRMIISSLIRQEALQIANRDILCRILARLEEREVQDVEDDYDVVYLKSIKDLARKLNKKYGEE